MYATLGYDVNDTLELFDSLKDVDGFTDWFKGFASRHKDPRLKGCYGEALYARDHIGIENIERMNHIDADGKDAIDFILKNGDHVEVKNRKLESVLTGTGENAQLVQGVKDQIAKHADRYREHVEQGGLIKYAFVKNYGDELNQVVKNRVIDQFASEWNVRREDAAKMLAFDFYIDGDVPF